MPWAYASNRRDNTMARKIMDKRVKRDIHHRDGGKCRKCGRCAQPDRKETLHAHHIIAEMDGGRMHTG